MFNIKGEWGGVICIICKIYIDIIKEQIKNENIKKTGSDVDPCSTPDSTLLYLLNKELILTLCIWLVK